MTIQAYLCIRGIENSDTFALEASLTPFFDIVVDFEIEKDNDEEWQGTHKNKSHPICDGGVDRISPQIGDLKWKQNMSIKQNYTLKN